MGSYPDYEPNNYQCPKTNGKNHQLVNKMVGSSRVSTICRYCGKSWATLDTEIRKNPKVKTS
jgi:hypothetical protein